RHGRQLANLRRGNGVPADAARADRDAGQVLIGRASRSTRKFVFSRLVCPSIWIALLASAVSPRAQTQGQATSSRPVFRSGTELVLVNVVVRDKTGGVVRDLTASDFSITEDDRPQTIVSFDFEELDRSDAAAEAASNRSVLA